MSQLQFQSRAAEGYDAAVGRITSRVAPFLLREARIEPGMTVLDIAGGTGIASERALEAVGPHGHVTCADISPAMLERAKTRLAGPNVTIAVEDGERLSFPDSSFDRVICNMGLMYFPHPTQGLSEFGRVVRRGGRVAVSNNISPEKSLVARVLLAIARHVPSKAGVGNAGWRADEGRLRKLFSDAGLERNDVCVETLRFDFESFADYFGGIEQGHGNVGQEFTALPRELRDKVRCDVLAECGGGGPFSLDIDIAIASGWK